MISSPDLRPGVTRRGLVGGVAACLAVVATPTRGRAAVAEFTDVLDRAIRVERPVRRVVLGEGRQIFVVGALDRGDPFGRVVGWRDDLIRADPASWRQYRTRDPAAADLPLVNGMRDGAFDAERVIALKPDVVLLDLGAKVASEETQVVETLASVGIPVAYIDFREKPLVNTERSVRLLGRLFGREEAAEDLIAFRATQIARVTDRLARTGGVARPLVMLDRVPGFSDECCLSFGAENFGRMVAMAGGRNLGSDRIPGTLGTLDPEAVLAADPDVVIATGTDLSAVRPGGAWVGLGPGADLREARTKLAGLMTTRPAFAGTKAVREGRVHAIWHQFYDNPYEVVAIQRIAKWLHPELFADLDPEATFRTLHERFLPVPYEPGYWVSLDGRS